VYNGIINDKLLFVMQRYYKYGIGTSNLSELLKKLSLLELMYGIKLGICFASVAEMETKTGQANLYESLNDDTISRNDNCLWITTLNKGFMTDEEELIQNGLM
jgi:hypothetical protein